MRTLTSKLLAMSFALAVLVVIAPRPASADECVRPRGPDILATKIVYFDFDSAKVTDSEAEKLKELAARFKGHPSLEVCSLGQADRSGAADYNQKLALRRATAVADVLKASGLQGAKYQIKSRGQSGGDKDLLERLFGDNMNFESDRRVEVMFIGN